MVLTIKYGCLMVKMLSAVFCLSLMSSDSEKRELNIAVSQLPRAKSQVSTILLFSQSDSHA